jgi:hypothetical protein
MPVAQLARQRFGRLVVIAFDSIRETPSGRTQAWWICQCDCGAQKVLRAKSLKGKGTVSCGCYRRDPAIRQAARWKLAPQRRKDIASLGGVAARDRKLQS